MDVIELRNPQALNAPDLVMMLKRAIDSGALLAPGGFDTVAVDIFDFVTNPNSFMLVGFEAGHFKSLVLGYFPVGQLFPYPTVILFYNEGTKKLCNATKKKLLDTLVARGYTQMLAVNSEGHPDDVWLRGLTPAGATSRIIGSLGMFEVS